MRSSTSSGARLGNRRRCEYGDLLRWEIGQSARGEMGWSAEWRKSSLVAADFGGRRWREYVCESFCDTGAFVAGGFTAHGEATLARSFRDRRSHWFGIILDAPRILI